MKESDPLKENVAEMLEHARQGLARDLDMLDELLPKAYQAAKKAKKYDGDQIKLVSHIAWCATKRAEIVSHLRQLEKHDRVMSRSPEQRFHLVTKYVEHEATPLQRAELLTNLTQLEQGRTVLS